MLPKDEEYGLHQNLSRGHGRGALGLLPVCSLHLFALGDSRVGAARVRTPVAPSLRAVASGDATLIRRPGTAPLPFTVRQPDARQLVVQLPGVAASQLAASYTAGCEASTPGSSTTSWRASGL